MGPDRHHGDPGERLLQLDDRGECGAGHPHVWDEISQTGGRHLYDRSVQGIGDLEIQCSLKNFRGEIIRRGKYLNTIVHSKQNVCVFNVTII